MSWIFIAVAIAFIVSGLVIHDKRRTGEAWKRIATNLKLTYYDVGVPSLRGQFRKQNVHLTIAKEGSGSRSQTYTRVEVHYKRFLNTAFQLDRQGYLQSARNFLGAQDIIVGHPGFDEAVVVKGRDEKAVRELFQRKSVRDACQSIVSNSRYTTVLVTNKKIEISFPGKAADTTRVRAILNHLIDVAEVLEKTEQAHPKQTSVAPPPLPVKKEKPAVPEEWHGQDIEMEHVPVPLPEEEVLEPASLDMLLEAEEATPLEPEPVLTSERVSEVSAADPTEDSLSLTTIAELLLEKDIGRYEAGKRFDEFFKGESIQWTGPLQAIAPGSSDRVFGHGSGWIAHFNSDKLSVKYRIGSNHRNRLEEQIGLPVELEGTLVKFDPFTETLYVQSNDPADSEPDRIISEIIPYSERIKKEMQSRPGEVREFS